MSAHEHGREESMEGSRSGVQLCSSNNMNDEIEVKADPHWLYRASRYLYSIQDPLVSTKAMQRAMWKQKKIFGKKLNDFYAFVISTYSG